MIEYSIYSTSIHGVSIIDKYSTLSYLSPVISLKIVKMWMHRNIEVLYMEFLSSIVFHTVLFIPCNIYVFCQNVDAPRI